MKILVCFKVVRDLATVIREDWANASDLSFDIDYTKKQLGLYDEAALETALCLSSNFEGAELFAATVADSGDISSFAGMLYAVGFSKVVRIDDGRDLRFSPEETAKSLAAFAIGESFDLIFTGMRTSPGNSGLVPAILARELSYRYIPDASNVEFSCGSLRVTRESDDGILTHDITRPSVVAMGNAVHAYLRPATLRQKRAASARQMEIFSLPERGSCDLPSVSFSRPDRTRMGRKLPIGEFSRLAFERLSEEDI